MGIGSTRARVGAGIFLASFCCACSGGPQLPSLPVADFSKLAVGSLPGEQSQMSLPSAEIYSRIARGANACWFGGRGRLAATHILHADAAPSMNGGAVEMVVHERAVDQPKPWGYKAFRVLLQESAGIDGTPGGGGTSIAVENTRIADAEAARMRSEVFQWAGGMEGCKADPALDKVPEPVAAAPVSPPPVKSAARKATPKSAASGGQAPAASPVPAAVAKE